MVKCVMAWQRKNLEERVRFLILLGFTFFSYISNKGDVFKYWTVLIDYESVIQWTIFFYFNLLKQKINRPLCTFSAQVKSGVWEEGERK